MACRIVGMARGRTPTLEIMGEATNEKDPHAHPGWGQGSIEGNDGLIDRTAEGDHERRDAHRLGERRGDAARKNSSAQHTPTQVPCRPFGSHPHSQKARERRGSRPGCRHQHPGPATVSTAFYRSVGPT